MSTEFQFISNPSAESVDVREKMEQVHVKFHEVVNAPAPTLKIKKMSK